MRLIDDSSECDFLDNRCEWPIKAALRICALMSTRPIPAANSWRTPPSRPRVLRRSRASACGPRGAPHRAQVGLGPRRGGEWSRLGVSLHHGSYLSVVGKWRTHITEDRLEVGCAS